MNASLAAALVSLQLQSGQPQPVATSSLVPMVATELLTTPQGEQSDFPGNGKKKKKTKGKSGSKPKNKSTNAATGASESESTAQLDAAQPQPDDKDNKKKVRTREPLDATSVLLIAGNFVTISGTMALFSVGLPLAGVIAALVFVGFLVFSLLKSETSERARRETMRKRVKGEGETPKSGN
jgi:hypothetical protein